MRNLIILAFIALFVAFASAQQEKGLEHLSKFLPHNAGERYCATEDIWKWRKAVVNGGVTEGLADCAVEGKCDNFAERNTWINKPLNISLVITVLCTSTACPLTLQQVNAQVNQINSDFNGTGFHFEANQTVFAVDDQYATIAAYSSFSSLWYTQIQALKDRHAQQPAEYLNIFVTRQTAGFQGTLLGIGTFPWDPQAPTNTGGLWMNANYIGAGFKTASHEIGHNIGLWHAFHGDSEVSCTSACYETVHDDSGDTTFSNTVGDFCADTPSQPLNYNCVFPTGKDCKGNVYNSIGNNPALLNNIMSYTPDTCMQQFSPQQSMRGSCWVCNALPGWVTGQCPQ